MFVCITLLFDRWKRSKCTYLYCCCHYQVNCISSELGGERVLIPEPLLDCCNHSLDHVCPRRAPVLGVRRMVTGIDLCQSWIKLKSIELLNCDAHIIISWCFCWSIFFSIFFYSGGSWVQIFEERWRASDFSRRHHKKTSQEKIIRFFDEQGHLTQLVMRQSKSQDHNLFFLVWGGEPLSTEGEVFFLSIFSAQSIFSTVFIIICQQNS